MIKVKHNRRVVVTGIGVVSSIGIGWEEFWKNLMAGKSGIGKITLFDASKYERQFAGEVRDFDPQKYIFSRKLSKMGRASQLALVASKLALKDSKLTTDQIKKKRGGICLGTTMGEPQVMEKLDERCFPDEKYNVDFTSAFAYPASLISANVALHLKAKSRNIMFSNACASGNYAVGYSYDLIKSGKADYMLAGGADAFSRIAFTGFSRLFAVAPEKCQPFDKNRKGMIPGEGAGVLILESYEGAKKRKANIYAEILGYALSCDAKHMTNPSVDGIVRAIKRSLNFSKVTIDQVDYISAHGTGTKENDKAECAAFNRVFGKYLSKIPVSSIKSMLGHTMGAAAALESIACCLAIKFKEVPPTIGFEEKDPDCEIDCVASKGRKQEVGIVLNNSQAFGGNNAALVFSQI